MTTGIYVNSNRKETALQAEELAATLVSRGFGCRKIFRLSGKKTEGLDMLLVLGGDGSALRGNLCAGGHKNRGNQLRNGRIFSGIRKGRTPVRARFSFKTE